MINIWKINDQFNVLKNRQLKKNIIAIKIDTCTFTQAQCFFFKKDVFNAGGAVHNTSLYVK